MVVQVLPRLKDKKPIESDLHLSWIARWRERDDGNFYHADASVQFGERK